MIGPRCEWMVKHRRYMEVQGWPVSQTHYGNPQSFSIPAERHALYNEPGESRIIWHAAFISSVNPAVSSREGCGTYLRQVIQHAAKFRISDIVVHTGAVSGVPIDKVLTGMHGFLSDEGIYSALADAAPVRIAVELGASTCGLNLNPSVFAERFKEHPSVGYCIDLAHVFAAGCPWRELWAAFSVKEPFVVHANFPGSPFGSSRDIHGWRSKPELEKQGRKGLSIRRQDVLDSLIENFDITIKMLHLRGIPLIVEGSGFPGSTVAVEMELLRSLTDGDQDEGGDHVRPG